MDKTLQHPRYEQLPYLETIDDVAKFIIDMVVNKDNFFMPGVLAAYEDMELSQGQIGLLEKYASPKLSQKLDKHLAGDQVEEIPAHLERAFWSPMVMAAYQILKPEPMGDQNAQQSRNLCVGLLYASMQANISNLKLFTQSNTEYDTGSSKELAREFGARNSYQIFENMPVGNVLQVFQRGIMPQFQRAIHQELGIDGKGMTLIQKKLQRTWVGDEAKSPNTEILAPINAMEWMRFGRLSHDMVKEEMDIASRESRKLLSKPASPEL